MRIIVYSPVAPQHLTDALGQSEYSYRFVLDHFMPVLHELGDVVGVSDPAVEVDPLFEESRARGEDCVFLCFAPPHRAPVGLRCPTSTVVAWEFDTIPDHAWGDEPRNDWTMVFADHGRAIVLSQHTADVVRAAMGPDFRVVAIPTPIADRFAAIAAPGGAIAGVRSVTLRGQTIDSRDYEISEQSIRRRGGIDAAGRPPWNGDPITLEFTKESEDRGSLIGFYNAEPWGTWSRIAQPWILLPFHVSGRVRVGLRARGYAENVGRRIEVSLGECTRPVTLAAARSEAVLDFEIAEPAAVLQFAGLDAAVPEGAGDVRTMGLGLHSVTFTRPPSVRGRLRSLRRRPAQSTEDPAPLRNLDLDGVVFTSVLNPGDGRKNWEQMVTAFCYAFRDTPDATLVLKMTHRSMASFFTNLQYQLHRIGPVDCRVVAVHGFLPDEEYTHLIRATTFYANASRAEGMCMPLMEFMSAGLPAIAPDNTAMADYVTPVSTFVVASSPVFAQWPHDDRGKITTTYNRVDWQSLTDAFRAAYDLATTDEAAYRAMGAAASAAQRAFCSDATVRTKLAEFLGAGVFA